MSLIIWIVLFYIGNILDLITTYWGMKGLPKEKMQEKELNPIISLFIHNKRATYAFKLALCTAIVIVVLRNPIASIYLSLLTIVVFFIIGNNILAYVLTKKGKLSPGKFLTEKCKLPKAFAYLAILGVCLFASLGVYLLL